MAANIPSLSVDTGEARSVTGHVISGALASGALAGALNYNKYLKGEIDKKEAISDSLKLSAQGGIATGSAIAAANYMGQGNIFGMLTAVSIGMAGVYAVEKVSEKIEERFLLEENINEDEE